MCVRGQDFFYTQAEYVCVRAHVLVISSLSTVYTGLTGAEVWAAHPCQQGLEAVGTKKQGMLVADWLLSL